MERASEICKQREVPLIVDEVQSAFCRTGPMFASERYDMEPDIIVLGKALGGGFPLSAALATPEYSTLAPWEYGFTMAGHPVSCAASLAMIEVMESENLMDHSARMGELMVNRLNEIKESSRLIGDVRGQGLMIGVELVQDKSTKEPAFSEAAAVVEAALGRGLMLGRTGPVFGNFGNVVKFKPAVNTDQGDLEDVLDRFASALYEVEGS
jgi:4-aminobutyrate aminotransferase-like enzyme